jgi:hypothetical protein
MIIERQELVISGRQDIVRTIAERLAFRITSFLQT